MLMSNMSIAFSTTLATNEVFMPVQLTTVPSRLLVTFIIVMVDTNGNAKGEESLENVKLEEFINTGVMARFRPS